MQVQEHEQEHEQEQEQEQDEGFTANFERIEPHRLANLSPVGVALLEYRRKQIELNAREAPNPGHAIRSEDSTPMPPTMSLPF